MENYKHIPFHGGHITWTADEPPSEEIMEAFEAMQEAVLRLHNVVDMLACGTCGKTFKPNDKWNYHCQECQPCKPLEQDN